MLDKEEVIKSLDSAALKPGEYHKLVLLALLEIRDSVIGLRDTMEIKQ